MDGGGGTCGAFRVLRRNLVQIFGLYRGASIPKSLGL